MCFNQPMSAGFAVFGYLSAWLVWRVSKNAKLTKAVAFFSLMETLQAVQYFFIARDMLDPQCTTWVNRVLTVLGYTHIQFQPYFTNLFIQSTRPQQGKAWAHEDVAWKIVGRLCLAQCLVGHIRLVLSPLGRSMDDDAELTRWYNGSKDWLEGPVTCTYHGSYHLAWSLPLRQPTYFLGGLGLHSFMMFVPALCIGGFSELDSIAFLTLTGPVFAGFVTSNLHEAASVWCFFSMLQCGIGATSAILQSGYLSSKGVKGKNA